MMNVTRFSIVCFLVLLLPSCSKPSPEAKWVEFVTESVGRDYRALEDESRLLQQTVQDFCDGAHRSAEHLNSAQAQWLKAMAAWQRVQWVRFGPIVDGNLDWQLQFWPDKKNLVQRKTQSLLGSSDTLDAAAIEKAGVVVQGLSELELLLFDSDYVDGYGNNDEASARQCQLLRLVSRHLVSTTSIIASKWNSPQDNETWLKQDKGEKGKEQVAIRNGKIIDGLLTQVDKVKTDKLGDPLGLKNKARMANGYFAESWRSSSSLANIHNNMSSLQSLLSSKDRYDLGDYLEEHGQVDLANNLVAGLQQILDQIERIGPPLNEAVLSQEAKDQVEQLYDQVKALNTLLRTELAPALGVALGFNSNDGD